MTKRDLMKALEPFGDDQEVVLDVDLALCHSDRNILTIEGVSDHHPETGLIFVDASHHWGERPEGRSLASDLAEDR